MTIQTDAVIVGAGPVGLFQVFELGLLGLKADLVDSLAQVGGQCSELYPEKPIYDIPAWPTIGAQELVDKLVEQIRPFDPGVHLRQEVTEFEALENGRFRVVTSRARSSTRAASLLLRALAPFSRVACARKAWRTSTPPTCITRSPTGISSPASA